MVLVQYPRTHIEKRKHRHHTTTIMLLYTSIIGARHQGFIRPIKSLGEQSLPRQKSTSKVDTLSRNEGMEVQVDAVCTIVSRVL